jgi:hypothetical protein
MLTSNLKKFNEIPPICIYLYLYFHSGVCFSDLKMFLQIIFLTVFVVQQNGQATEIYGRFFDPNFMNHIKTNLNPTPRRGSIEVKFIGT